MRADDRRAVRSLGPVTPRTVESPRRNKWISVAAMILIVEGGLAMLYAPIFTGSSLWPPSALLMVVLGLGVLNVTAGVGLLRLSHWARPTAGVLAAGILLFLYAPAFIVALSRGVGLGFDWLGIVGYVVVLVAVVRHWPAADSSDPSPRLLG